MVGIVSTSSFLETDIREQQKYKMRMQTSVDNAVKGLRYEIKFENRVKDKNNFLVKKNISFLFKINIYFILGNIFLRFLSI